MGPTRSNIEPTCAQHTPNMNPTKAQHRTYGFVGTSELTLCNTPVQTVAVAKRAEYFMDAVLLFCIHFFSAIFGFHVYKNAFANECVQTYIHT